MSSKNREKREGEATTSIARKITMSYWSRQLFQFLMIDVLLIVLITLAYLVASEPELIISWKERAPHLGMRMAALWEAGRVPFYILLVVETVFVVQGLFSTGMVKKHLKPLQDMAQRAEELTLQARRAATMAEKPDKERLRTMEKAIEKIDPQSPDPKVKTGDKELLHLEHAINNLLDGMRESSRQQERFISDASHELRTPIAVIQGYVNMLDRWGKEDSQVLTESIEALKNESEHMKTLVEQLLFLARGDSGRNTLDLTDFDLREVVSSVTEESSMIDEDHRYSLKEQAGEPVMIKGDLALIKQAMRIFIQNASKYSEKGAEILLGAGKTPEGRPYFTIQDEGRGMNSEEIVHVFERFYRAGDGRNKGTGGTGLGLSIAKWIVDAHEGEIEMLSRPDFGTRITVKLGGEKNM